MDIELGHYLELRPKRDGRLRPFLKGTRVSVLSLVRDAEHHAMTADEIAVGYDNVSVAAVHAALAYFHENRETVREMIREDDAFVRRLREEHGGVAAGQESHDDPGPLSP